MRQALIVEDFKIIANMWETLLLEEGFTHIYISYNCEEIEQYMLTNHPEIILMDVNLPSSKNGIELTETLLTIRKELKIIMLTIHNEPSIIKKSFEAGAKAFITKNSGIKEIKKAIQKVQNGERYLCDESFIYKDYIRSYLKE
ncbi:MAG: response regulator transcription factor [Crocinitomicaceae bacterium]|nr:response regulator transcription factor [Crocinitomicaceae bacterium]